MTTRKKLVTSTLLVLAAVLIGALVSANSGRDAQAEEKKAAAGTVDVKSALAERGLGDPKAPVRLDEFASLSCNHCADFSRQNFDKLKVEYIDTGKVYFVYNDFPLNKSALDATLVSRCMPADRYFSFVKFLFDTQEKWAFKPNHVEGLRQGAKLAGMDDATFDACIGNKELTDTLVANLQKSIAKHKIESTPTFIINDTQTLHGALPYENLKKALDQALAAKKG